MPKWTIEQLAAINESGQNIIVSAGAGSGKTAVLTERVITKLKKGISLDNLLILTFTNAAAIEMKNRIKNKILENEALKDELNKVDSADITTFDAYALSLVKKYSHLLNISPNIKIADSSIIQLEKKHILEDIFNEYYENEKFLKLVNDFTLKDDRVIFENILNLNTSLDNLYDKKGYLKSYKINNKYINDYMNLIFEKRKNLINVIHNLSYYTDDTYLEKLNKSLDNLFKAKTYDEIKVSFPSRLSNLPKDSSEEAKEIKKEISKIINNLKDLTKYPDTNYIKKSIEATKEYSEIIIEIILKLDQRLTEFKKEKAVYEFIDIARMAIKILKDNENIRNTLKEKYHEILIDEYQDTNDIQELFISLLEKNNVYMVGDIKQSIYRFRHANPKLFKEKYENYSKENGGLKIDLNKNFRSRFEVLNNINKIFNLVMDSDIGGADYLNSHQMIFGNIAYTKSNDYNLEILNYSKDEKYSNDEIEIFTIAYDIKNKIGKFKIKDKLLEYKDIAILVDRSTSFELYKKIFEYLNIPLTIYRDKAITSSLEIVLLKHIYNLILSNKKDSNFKYSFTSIARSYLFEMNDNIIYNYLNNLNFEDSDLYQKCLTLRKNLDIKTNESLILEIIDTFDFYNRMITIGNINMRITIIDSLIKVARECDKLGYTIKDFYNYLNEILESNNEIKLSLNKEENNSVKIMTIHASKGLEFPVCYYSGLSKKFNIADLKNLFYFSSKYGLILPYYDDGPKNTILKTLLKEDYLKEEIAERIRLFYVALTRAKEKIILVSNMEEILSYKENGIISNDIRLKYSSFQSILNSIYNSLEKYIVGVSDLKLTKEYNLGKQNVYINKLSTVKLSVDELNINKEVTNINHFSKTTHKLFTKEEKDNIELGLKFHSILENIDFEKPDFSYLSSFEKEKITSFLKLDILKNTLNMYKEYEFIYTVENTEYHGVIDLLLIKNDYNVIIDYKLKNVIDDAYVLQLNGYKKYIETISNKPTRIYLYSILDEKLVSLNKKI